MSIQPASISVATCGLYKFNLLNLNLNKMMMMMMMMIVNTLILRFTDRIDRIE